jgi:hypothetical protein
MNKLLTYAETKTIFGWKSTSSIRRYVTSGDLVRVQIGQGMNTYRITEESAQAFLKNIRDRDDEREYAERAAAHTRKMREAIPAPEPEVMLDAEEIIRQSHIRTPRPAEKPTLDEVIAERSQSAAPLPTAPHRAGLGFRSVRGV